MLNERVLTLSPREECVEMGSQMGLTKAEDFRWRFALPGLLEIEEPPDANECFTSDGVFGRRGLPELALRMSLIPSSIRLIIWSGALSGARCNSASFCANSSSSCAVSTRSALATKMRRRSISSSSRSRSCAARSCSRSTMSFDTSACDAASAVRSAMSAASSVAIRPSAVALVTVCIQANCLATRDRSVDSCRASVHARAPLLSRLRLDVDAIEQIIESILVDHDARRRRVARLELSKCALVELLVEQAKPGPIREQHLHRRASLSKEDEECTTAGFTPDGLGNPPRKAVETHRRSMGSSTTNTSTLEESSRATQHIDDLAQDGLVEAGVNLDARVSNQHENRRVRARFTRTSRTLLPAASLSATSACFNRLAQYLRLCEILRSLPAGAPLPHPLRPLRFPLRHARRMRASGRTGKTGSVQRIRARRRSHSRRSP